MLSLFVLANLFVWTYLPQVALLYLFHREAAWFNATVLVLSEGAAVVALLFECFFVDETQVDIFDAVRTDVHFGFSAGLESPCRPKSLQDKPG